MAPDLEPSARCAHHPETVAAGTCERCGRFACAWCGRTEGVSFLCAECLARPDVRLAASPRARRAFWLALLGLHGIVVALPIAAWTARLELAAIERGDSPPGGKAWAQGALATCWLGMVLWLPVAIAVMTR